MKKVDPTSIPMRVNPSTSVVSAPSRPLLPALLVILLLPARGIAQQEMPTEVSVSVFNNAIALPFSGKAGVLHAPLHPGVSLGIGKQLNHNAHHQLLLNLKMTYLYQKRAQHVVQLYPELGYRLATGSGIGVESRLGLGYLHAFRDLEQFKLNGQGSYEKVPNRGRPGLVASLAIGLSYNLAGKTDLPARLFTQYQVWFQTPFVKSYVPVLPNAALHVGGAFYLSQKAK